MGTGAIRAVWHRGNGVLGSVTVTRTGNKIGRTMSRGKWVETRLWEEPKSARGREGQYDTRINMALEGNGGQWGPGAEVGTGAIRLIRH